LGKESDSRVAETEIIRILRERGFDVVEAAQREGEVFQHAQEKHAEILLTGKATSEEIPANLEPLVSCGAHIEARAFYTAPPRHFLAAGGLEVGADPRLPGVVAVTKNAASQGALRKAAVELLTGDRAHFLAQMYTAWVTGPKVVYLQISPVKYPQLLQSIQVLKEQRFVDQVIRRAFTGGVAELEVRTDEARGPFIDRVAGLTFEGFAWDLVGIEGNLLELQVAVEEPDRAAGEE
jgi:hypothetical protein